MLNKSFAIRRIRCAVAAVVFGASASVASGQTVAANNIPPGPVTFASVTMAAGLMAPLSQTPNAACAQKFTATAGGALQSMTVTVDRILGGEDLIVGIRDGFGPDPGALLGEITVPETSFDPFFPIGDGIATFDFTGSGINLVAGRSYFVTFRTLTAPTISGARYTLHMQDPSLSSFGIVPHMSRDGGATWFEVPDFIPAFTREIGMTVNVGPIPVPTVSEWGMISLAGALCLGGFFLIRRA